MAKQQAEYVLQKQACQYLRVKYPRVLFMSDTIASVKLTIPQALRNKAIQCENFKCPDLIIFEPKGKYKGLFIELKSKDIYKKNSKELLKNEHVEAQLDTITRLLFKGYFACFCVGIENTIDVIEMYMNEKL